MKILYVNNTDPEDGGGGDKRLFDEAATLAEMGADITVIASRTDPELSSRRVSREVEIRTVKCVPDFFQRFPTLHFYLARSLFPLISFPVLVLTLYGEEFDVIVDSHTPHPSLVPFPGWLFSVPVVALVHEFHDRSALSKYPLPIGLIQLAVQNFLRSGLYAAVIVPREQSRQALKDYGVQTPIHVIPNGIEIETYLDSPKTESVESYDFLVISRLVHRKGIDRLLKAMAVVVAERPDVHLGIAGDGPKRDELESLAKELGINDNVSFLGFVSEDNKRALLHESHVFVCPSRQEGFGIAVLEAMAVGRVIVANDLDILQELVPEESNRLADASNPEEFAMAMIEALTYEEDPDRAPSDVNQREAKQYSLENVGQQAESVYEQCVQV